jgi:hypothetical protein
LATIGKNEDGLNTTLLFNETLLFGIIANDLEIELATTWSFLSSLTSMTVFKSYVLRQKDADKSSALLTPVRVFSSVI